MTWFSVRMFMIVPSVMSTFRSFRAASSSSWSCALGERGLLAVLAHVQAFGVDKFDVSNAQEAEEIAHVSRLAVERRAGVEARRAWRR